ncbi:low molecular weight neuronal intermediate filament-like [Chelonoidis abingdonii]|uniref:IF rod domain-containing protein n=1 Tax=Chelonoidis abingdonii TaxID=106734 RepID=A0A8C0GTX6_CHEAB|nr:low molecular weight neuronal intermediate filament-like [Chelonoidis abingdonii]
MSYGSDLLYPLSSFKKIFGETSRLSSRVYSSSSAPRAAGYRAHHARDSYPSSYRKLAVPSSVDHLELLSQSSAVSNELKIVRTNEKEQLQGLNDRFVTYIEKVHQLEQHNRLLEAEVSLLRQRQAEPSRLQQLYEQEIRELRAKVEELRHEGDEAQLESQQLAQGLQRLREQCQEEARRREEAELALREYRKDVDHATLGRLELEKKVESLLDEIAFLRKVHEEEVAELQASLQDAQVSVEVDVSKPDLTAALKEIRMQYEVLSARNQQSAEEWYKSKFANFTEEAARSSDSIRQAKEEITEYRRQLQARNIEIEALRNANESLERQLQEVEERSNGEIHNLQETINQLENALRTTKGEMARHLREYQDLLNVKMALDIEIAAYRKLLEGEETRLSTVSSGNTFGLGYTFSSGPFSGAKAFSTSTVTVKREEKQDLQESIKDPRLSEEPKPAEEDQPGEEKAETISAKN